MALGLFDLSSERGVRRATVGLGIGTVLFGIAPAIAPRRFARLFGLPDQGGQAALAASRSLGIRDVVIGTALISAAMHGGKLAPWLLARTLTDSGDALVVSFVFGKGDGNNRLAALGGLAFSAALVDHALWHAARRVQRPIKS